MEWILFNLFILVALAVDLLFLHRSSREIQLREAIITSAVWIGLALLFCLGVYVQQGREPALNFLSGYLIEKMLSVDNLFVFLFIFSYFKVPERYRHKVLFWGVLGALVIRGLFIFAGVVLIERFSWLTYLFGIFLIFTGIKFAQQKGHEIDIEKNPLIRLLKRVFPVTEDYQGEKFFLKKGGQYWITPLFVVLIAVETTDVIFAVDSVPAILAITTDPFIVYTSNVFAVLGLRTLFFALAHLLRAFKYLQYGLAVILVLIGIKMTVSQHIHIPTGLVLAAIVFVLVSTIFASIWTDKRKKSKK